MRQAPWGHLYRDSTLRLIRVVKSVKGDPDAETVKISFCKPGTTKAPAQLTTFANTLDGATPCRA